MGGVWGRSTVPGWFRRIISNNKSKGSLAAKREAGGRGKGTMRRGWSVYGVAAVLMGALSLPCAVEGAPAQGGKKAPVSRKATVRKSAAKRSKGRVNRGRRVRGQKAPEAGRIMEIQQALTKSGAYSGKSSGKWDAATVAAMKKFQGEQGLNPTGKMDARSLQKLGLGSEIAGLGAPIPMAGGPAGDERSSRNPD